MQFNSCQLNQKPSLTPQKIVSFLVYFWFCSSFRTGFVVGSIIRLCFASATHQEHIEQEITYKKHKIPTKAIWTACLNLNAWLKDVPQLLLAMDNGVYLSPLFEFIWNFNGIVVISDDGVQISHSINSGKHARATFDHDCSQRKTKYFCNAGDLSY